MKSTNKTFLAAAALTAALSAPALAQTPGVDSSNQNQGSGATSTDPSNESNRNSNTNTNATTTSGADVNADGEIGSTTSRDASTSADGVDQPRKKRTFWDRVFGRNKHLDADKNGDGRADSPADTTPSTP